MSSSNPAASSPIVRLTSLDQFRGYIMLGMLLVNFIGGYAVCPRILKHTHDYCSYADTIMPGFLFAAGFAMRLSLGKRLEAGGKMPWGRAVRRILGLALVAIVWYSLNDLPGIVEKFMTQPPGKVFTYLFKRQLFATLMHIAVTSLWILPVITASWKVRVIYAIASGLLHVLVSWWFNFAWVYADPRGVDGGPLGILTWAIPALCGTLACDAVRYSGPKAAFRIALSGVGVMLLGWVISNGSVLYNVPADQVLAGLPAEIPNPASALKPSNEETAATADKAIVPPTLEKKPAPKKSKEPKFAPDPVIPTLARIQAWDGTFVEPPFVPPPDSNHRLWNYWMMSQRGGTLSYPTFAAGLSLVTYALFLWLCDGLQLRLGIFRTLGTNSLAAYILHDIAGWVVSPWFSEKSTSVPLTMAGFACFALFVYAICRLFESQGWYIRV